MDNTTKETMTKEQVIETTIGVLGRIEVPVEYMEKIGNPIVGAIKNLFLVRGMMEAEKKMNEEPAGDTQEDAAEEEENG